MNVHCVVLISNSTTKIIIDRQWVDMSAIGAHELNYGLKKHILRKVFYSPEAKSANFDLPISEQFDENADGCYEGFVLQSFGE